ncbi:MAG: M56 family metallopeptidase [Oscillospiraceae bacterium]|jgi:beta-lactamase regulating signal transducer with metallopeptidase domain|nr:M56 family metallopeptidase [Oscillospiraceae bacterium]
MLDEKLYMDALRTLLVMTVSGSILAALLLALKPLIKNRLPKSAQRRLWLVVIAALLIPVSRFVTLPSNRESVVLPNSEKALQGSPTTIYETVQMYAISTEESLDVLQSDGDFYNLHYDDIPGELTFPIMDVISAVYPFGFSALLLYHIIAYAVFRRKIRRDSVSADIDCGIPVYRSASAATPMLVGLFRPFVILPDREYTDGQLQNVLLHELAHRRRKDILIKWLSMLATAVHWFNPLVWLARRELDRAIEFAADEAVVRNLDDDGRRSYGDTLLYVAADAKASLAVLSTTMCEDKRDLKERLSAIMKIKKRTRAAALLSAALFLSAALTVGALGAGNDNRSMTTRDLRGFSAWGIQLGQPIDPDIAADLIPMGHYPSKEFEYNFKGLIHYSLDKETGIVTKLSYNLDYPEGRGYAPFASGGEVWTTIDQVVAEYGEGKQWRELDLMGPKFYYVEYTQKEGEYSATVRFQSYDGSRKLLNVYAESNFPSGNDSGVPPYRDINSGR